MNMSLIAHKGSVVRDQVALFEALEPRLLLAGDVTATVVGGSLYIVGDAAANDIIIDQTGLASDEFMISSGTDVTTINGLPGRYNRKLWIVG